MYRSSSDLVGCVERSGYALVRRTIDDGPVSRLGENCSAQKLTEQIFQRLPRGNRGTEFLGPPIEPEGLIG